MIDPMMLLSLAGGLGGGGGTEVSQSANNSTSISLSSILNNQGTSPIDASPNAQTSSAATAAAGTEPQSFDPSPLAFPSLGTTTSARAAVQETANPNAPNDGVIYASIGVIGLVGIYTIFFSKKKKKR